jgi:phage-related minor tail protein
MTDRIREILSALELKFSSLNQSFTAVRKENNQLLTQNSLLEKELNDKNERVFMLEQELNRLKNQLSLLVKEKEDQANLAISNEHAKIDGLVREIENCIELLKQ